MEDLNVETPPGARASGLSLLLLLILLLGRASGFCNPLYWSCGCSGHSGKKVANDKTCIEDKGKEEKGHVETDPGNWGWESSKERDKKQVLLRKTTQKCAVTPVCDTESDSRAEVLPDYPVMEEVFVKLIPSSVQNEYCKMIACTKMINKQIMNIYSSYTE